MNKFLFVLLFSVGVSAQIGINTKTPQGILHIDGKGDTSEGENDLDDFVNTEDGLLGIGTVKPEAQIHIKTGGTSENPIPGFVLQDGTQGFGHALTRDKNGLIHWVQHTPATGEVAEIQTASAPSPVYLSNGTGGSANRTSRMNYSHLRITLPPGRWLIYVSLFIARNGGTNTSANNNKYFEVSGTFSERASALGSYTTDAIATIKSNDIEGPYIIRSTGMTTNSSFGGSFSGSLVINNTSSADKTYYFYVGRPVVYGGTSDHNYRVGGNFSENTILGIQLPENEISTE